MLYESGTARDSFRRVQDLADSQAGAVPALKNSDGRHQLDAAVIEITARDTEQQALDLQIEGKAQLKLDLETELRTQHLQPISDFARGKLQNAPEFATLTRGVAGLEGKALAHAAYAVAKASQPYQEQMTTGGLPADTVEQLTSCADKLVATIDARSNLRVQRAGVTTAMRTATKQGKDAVKMLDGVVKKYFARDKTFLSSWRSARRITLKPGVPRGTTAQTTASPTTTVPTTPTTPTTTTTVLQSEVQGSKAA